MAKSVHVGFRAHIQEDKDILDDLNRFADKTGRLKDVYRKVMAMEAQAFQPLAASIKEPTEVLRWAMPNDTPEKETTKESLDWRKNFPEKENEQKPADSRASTVKSNILNSF